MNLTTWLNEQAHFVRVELMNGDLRGARNALRFAYGDGYPEGLWPDMIVHLALFPLNDEEIAAVRDVFIRQAENTFTGDHLDRGIRVALYTALYRDRH